jgi:hypothetical protein
MAISTKQLAKNKIFGSCENATVGQDIIGFLSEVYTDVSADPISDISFIGSNSNYDSYKFECKDKSLFAKISYECPSPTLEYESKCIKRVAQPVVPTYKTGGEYLNISYLITSFENAPSLDKINQEANMDLIWGRLYQLHQCDAKNLKTFSDIIKANSEDNISDVNEGEDPRAILRKSDSLFLRNFRSKVVKKCQQLVKHSEGDDFCHGSLKESHILTNGQDYKFCNLTNCFIGNGSIDKINFAYELGIERDQLVAFTGIKESESNLIALVGLYRILLLINEYLNQKYIFEFLQPRKLYLMALNFLNNSEIFQEFIETKEIEKIFELTKKMLGINQ